jgi:hypothetical protein
MTALAAMIAPSPMVTPGMTTASRPIHTSFPMTVLPRLWILGQKLRGVFEPSPAEDEERESRQAHHLVVCGRQEEFGIHGNGAELADNQLLRAGRVEHVPGLEESRIVRVVIVGEFSAVLCGSCCPGEKAAWLSAQGLD